MLSSKTLLRQHYLTHSDFSGLVIGGIGLIIADKACKKDDRDDQKSDINYRQAFKIGCWQCLSLWPGMSRSAMTMIGGLSSGLNRVTSASFSFIIAVPVMIIVVIYELVSSISQLSVINYFWVFLERVYRLLLH